MAGFAPWASLSIPGQENGLIQGDLELVSVAGRLRIQQQQYLTSVGEWAPLLASKGVVNYRIWLMETCGILLIDLVLHEWMICKVFVWNWRVYLPPLDSMCFQGFQCTSNLLLTCSYYLETIDIVDPCGVLWMSRPSRFLWIWTILCWVGDRQAYIALGQDCKYALLSSVCECEFLFCFLSSKLLHTKEWLREIDAQKAK